MTLFASAYATQQITAQIATESAHRITFEAASIRHRPGNSGPTETKIETGGRFVAANATLKVLILFAHQYMPWQVSGGPDWANSAAYDIQAKPEMPASNEEVRSMLRNLLTERFALRTTKVMRNLPVYVLAVDKRGARLRPSRDPQSAPQIMRGPEGQTVFRNTPISQLVNFLALRLSRNVIDETGLQGAFDFDFAWTPDLPRRSGGVDAAQPAEADSPSVFAAARDQLGLTLKSTKRPVPILVIESARKPPEN